MEQRSRSSRSFYDNSGHRSPEPVDSSTSPKPRTQGKAVTYVTAGGTLTTERRHVVSPVDREAARSQISAALRDAIKAKRSLYGFRLTSLSETFRIIDADGNGGITGDELAVALKRLGHGLPADQVRDLVRAADTDRDGSIDCDEFVAMLRKPSNAARRSGNKNGNGAASSATRMRRARARSSGRSSKQIGPEASWAAAVQGEGTGGAAPEGDAYTSQMAPPPQGGSPGGGSPGGGSPGGGPGQLDGSSSMGSAEPFALDDGVLNILSSIIMQKRRNLEAIQKSRKASSPQARA